MLISTKGRYALRVMADLARNGGEEYVVLMDIAERQNISEKYLEASSPRSAAAVFADAARPRGRLPARPLPGRNTPSAISSVLREGSIAPVSCVKSGESECPNADQLSHAAALEGA